MSLRRPNGFISAGYDPLEVPNAPTIGTASIASATSVSVTFTAPSNVGGSAITGYVATAKKTSDGTTISGTGSSSPVTISGLTTGDAYTVTVAAANSFGLGVSSAASNSVTPLEFELYAWGANDWGQLGLNNTTYRSSPVQVGALAGWSEIAVGNNASLAVRENGTLWSWGINGSGQLGQDNTINRSSPVQVGALTAWRRVAYGNYFSLATKTDGTFWSWGINSSGQLGLNDTANRSSPVQVGALTNWSQIAAGGGFSAAVKTDGTLWTWGIGAGGSGRGGMLGLGDTQSRSSPTQVGLLTDWTKVATGYGHCIAVKTNGTLWAWGTNLNGQLGLGDGYVSPGNYSNRSSPVQVGALTGWADVAAGGTHSLAIKTDGTLWSWGYNGSGRLGQNNTVNRSSPVQVGALTSWVQASGANESSSAVKNDGTLWSWGRNNNGQLGLNDTANRSSPVQVGALATWSKIAIGSRAEHMLVLKG